MKKLKLKIKLKKFEKKVTTYTAKFRLPAVGLINGAGDGGGGGGGL